MKLALAALLLAVPAAARADIGVRLGLEAHLADHDGNHNADGSPGSHTTLITDQQQLEGNLMLSYWMGDALSLDGEISELYNFKTSTRVGTTFRVGVTFNPPVVPLYFRAAIPIHLEPSPFYSGLRAGVGTTFSFVLAKVYLELDADFPLFGGTGAPGAFSTQSISLGSGVQFKF